MKLVVGLGNPGKKYESTRHNIGFLVVDEIARRFDGTFRNKTSVEAALTEVQIEDERVLLCKPKTFMNASGKAVKKVMKKNGITIENVLVIYDDADLSFGDIRYRESGSAGGHNGIQSILNLFTRGTALARVRVGIGRPSHLDFTLEDWVLGVWSEKERDLLPKIIEDAAEETQDHIKN